jgi:ABC-type multidrug transport system permease subunit
MKELIHRAMIGIAFSAVTYLLIISLNNVDEITMGNTLSVFGAGALIGIGSLIFDIEQLNYWLAIILHFILTQILINGLMLILDRPLSWGYFVNITIIYIIIWLVVLVDQWSDIRKINGALKRRQKQNNS